MTAQAPTPAELGKALRAEKGMIGIEYAFSLSGENASGYAARVYSRGKGFGPLIIPDRANGQSLGDVLHMLGDLVEREES